MKINTLLELSVDVFNISKETEMRYKTDFINSVMKENFSHLWPFFLMEWVQIFLSRSKFFACMNMPYTIQDALLYLLLYFSYWLDLLALSEKDWDCSGYRSGVAVFTDHVHFPECGDVLLHGIADCVLAV